MKTIGIIAGMSWESSAVYYREINRAVQARLGGLHSAKILMDSLDFAEIAALQDAGAWEEATDRLTTSGVRLARAGADFLIIACNTMHRSAAAIERAAKVPLLHIADPLGKAIARSGQKRVALLGSRHTMRDGDILRGRLMEHYGLELLVPEGEDFVEVDRIINRELTRGIFSEASRDRCRDAIARLAAAGAEGAILGCTELPLLVRAEDADVPLFDTTALHVAAAVDYVLS